MTLVPLAQGSGTLLGSGRGVNILPGLLLFAWCASICTLMGTVLALLYLRRAILGLDFDKKVEAVTPKKKTAKEAVRDFMLVQVRV